MKNHSFAILTATFLFCFQSVLAQNGSATPQINKIVVTGSHEMEVEPDEIYVNFILREYLNNKKEKVDLEVIRKEFLNACSSTSIPKENIKVHGVAGSAYDNWFIRKRKKDPEFKANITYIIKFSSPELLNSLISKLNDEAISNLYISKKSHSKIEEYRKEVKIKATQAAKAKATYLAESIGEKIRRALLIEEINNDGYQQPMLMRKSNSAMFESEASGYSDNDSMPFENINIRYEIRAEFELF